MTHYEFGKLKMESPADEFIKKFTRENNHTSVKFPAEELSFQIKSKDMEKRRVTMSIHGNLVSKIYKIATVAFSITPSEQIQSRPSTLEYNFELEKFSPDIGDPKQIVDTLLDHIRSIDENLYEPNQSVKFNSIEAEYPADECFEIFIQAFQDDEDIKIDAEDWENRKTTMSLKSSHYMMTNFKTFKVTTTITPHQQDANGSHVNWTIEAEKIEGILDRDIIFTTAIMIRDKFQIKLQKKKAF